MYPSYHNPIFQLFISPSAFLFCRSFGVTRKKKLMPDVSVVSVDTQSHAVSCWATWSQDLVTTLTDNYGLIYECKWMKWSSGGNEGDTKAVHRLFLARGLLDGSVAVRTLEVFKEYTGSTLVHSCKTAHRLCCNAHGLWLRKDLSDTFSCMIN